jgi:hypothetical protein
MPGLPPPLPPPLPPTTTLIGWVVLTWSSLSNQKPPLKLPEPPEPLEPSELPELPPPPPGIASTPSRRRWRRRAKVWGLSTRESSPALGWRRGWL